MIINYKNNMETYFNLKEADFSNLIKPSLNECTTYVNCDCGEKILIEQLNNHKLSAFHLLYTKY